MSLSFSIYRNITQISTQCKSRIFHSFTRKKNSNLSDYNGFLIKLASQKVGQNLCWKCGLERKNVTNVFCETCKVIQKPYETENYFKVFNIEEQFNIDTKILRDKYKRLQNDLHPDRFVNRTNEERTISADFSSLVNKAYDNLLVPLKRAEHLLELKGDKVCEDQTLVDPNFLMMIMELNEEVENTVDPEKLRELNIKNKNELEKIALSIDECFKECDLEKAKFFVIKMKYYASLGSRINNILREMGVVD